MRIVAYPLRPFGPLRSTCVWPVVPLRVLQVQELRHENQQLRLQMAEMEKALHKAAEFHHAQQVSCGPGACQAAYLIKMHAAHNSAADNLAQFTRQTHYQVDRTRACWLHAAQFCQACVHDACIHAACVLAPNHRLPCAPSPHLPRTTPPTSPSRLRPSPIRRAPSLAPPPPASCSSRRWRCRRS